MRPGRALTGDDPERRRPRAATTPSGDDPERRRPSGGLAARVIGEDPTEAVVQRVGTRGAAATSVLTGDARREMPPHLRLDQHQSAAARVARDGPACVGRWQPVGDHAGQGASTCVSLGTSNRGQVGREPFEATLGAAGCSVPLRWRIGCVRVTAQDVVAALGMGTPRPIVLSDAGRGAGRPTGYHRPRSDTRPRRGRTGPCPCPRPPTTPGDPSPHR